MITVDHSTVELIKHNASDDDVAFAAWVSNFAAEARNRPLERVAGLINFLYREKHMTPFEHGSFTFFIDTPLFVAREFMRHRTFSYNEVSGRYKKMEGRFYLPPFERPLVKDPESKVGAYKFLPGTDEQYAWLVKNYTEYFERGWTLYNEAIERGIANEVARINLPLSLYTQFYATANPRNVMQFLILRNDDPALYEIRDVAIMMEQHFADAMPLTYAAFDRERAVWKKVRRLLQLVDLDELLADIDPDKEDVLV